MNAEALERRMAKGDLRLTCMSFEDLRRQNRGAFGSFNGNGNFRVEIENRGRRDERFLLAAQEDVQVEVMDVDKALRNAVLMARAPGGSPVRFLLGHDEREYFIAELPETARITTVRQAREALKAEPVREAEGLGHRVRRQGEWFFRPVDQEAVPTHLPVHRREPLARTNARGGLIGKPHMAKELIRTNGETVEVQTGRKLPNGEPETRQMVRPGRVFVKGTIRHPDHKTLRFLQWMEVFPNMEVSNGRNTTFVD